MSARKISPGALYVSTISGWMYIVLGPSEVEGLTWILACYEGGGVEVRPLSQKTLDDFVSDGSYERIA